MATLTQTYKPNLVRITWNNKCDEFIEKLTPRRFMVASVGLILAGLGIPALMEIPLLPVALLHCSVYG